MNNEFKIGQTVRHITNKDIIMVVIEIKDDSVKCTWLLHSPNSEKGFLNPVHTFLKCELIII